MNNHSYITDQPPSLDQKEISSLSENLLKQTADTKLVSIAKALSDPTKLKIYLLLKRIPEVSVGDVSTVTKISQSTASHALADLRKLGIVKPRRCGQVICYSLSNSKETTGYLSKLSYMLS